MPASTLRHNIVSNYAGRAYSILAIYIFTPFYIRFLGIEAFGIISLYSILLLITAVADIGLSSTFTREAARQGGGPGLIVLLSSIEAPLLLLSAALSLLPFMFSDYVVSHWLGATVRIDPESVTASIRIMAAMIPVQMLITLYGAGLMGLQRQVALNTWQAGYVTIRSGLVVPVIAVNPSVELFLIWQLIAMLAYAVVLRTVLVRTMGRSAFAVARPSLQLLRSIATFSTGAFAIALISNFNNQLDKLFVSARFPVAEFGYYGAAASLTQIANAAVAPIIAAIFPLLVASVEAHDAERTTRLFAKYSTIIGFIAALAAAFLAFFAHDIVEVWLGSSVPPYVGDVVRLLAVGWLFFAWQLMPTYLALANGRTSPVVLASVGLTIVAAPLLFFLSARHGLVGAAVPWPTANIAAFLILFALVIPRYYPGSAMGWLWRKTVFPGFVAAAAAAGARFIAELVGQGALASCLIGGLCGMMALAGFLYWVWQQPGAPYADGG